MKKENKFFMYSIVVTMIIITLFTIMGVLKNEYWRYIIYEKSPMGYYEALLLFLCFVVSGMNFIKYSRENNKINISRGIITMGFFYLFLDEKFGIHENIRERILKPNGIKIDFLYWMEPGDYALLGILILGLITAMFLLKELKKNKRGFIFFTIGVLFSIMAVLDDSLNLKGMNIEIQKMIQYAEEIIETCGMICFLNSVVTVMLQNKNSGAVRVDK